MTKPPGLGEQQVNTSPPSGVIPLTREAVANALPIPVGDIVVAAPLAGDIVVAESRFPDDDVTRGGAPNTLSTGPQR